jgi:Spy/CpxP family protein refolding chaperone
MNAKRILTVAVLVTLGWACAVPALSAAESGTTPVAAAGALERGPHERLERLHKLLHELDLTAAQKAEIKAIVEPFRKELETWRAGHKAELEKIRGEIKAARAAKDRTQMKAALAELRTLMETAPKLKEILPQIKAVLTPEQLAKVKARLEELREKAQERRAEKAGGQAA